MANASTEAKQTSPHGNFSSWSIVLRFPSSPTALTPLHCYPAFPWQDKLSVLSYQTIPCFELINPIKDEYPV